MTGGCDLGIKYEIEGLLGSVEQMLTLTASKHGLFPFPPIQEVYEIDT